MAKSIRNIIVLGTVIFLLSNCKKKEDPEPMKQILFTEEGTPYMIKTVTSTAIVNSVTSPQIQFNAAVNWGATIPEVGTIHVDAQKKIIPLYYAYSSINSVPAIQVNVAECYFSVSQKKAGAGFINYPMYRKSLAKLAPYITRVFYTDDVNHNYTNQYNQVVLADADFLEVNNGLNVTFYPSLAEAMADRRVNFPQVPVAQAVFTVTFTYYEML